jgi:hypothetical protein
MGQDPSCSLAIGRNWLCFSNRAQAASLCPKCFPGKDLAYIKAPANWLCFAGYSGRSHGAGHAHRWLLLRANWLCFARCSCGQAVLSHPRAARQSAHHGGACRSRAIRQLRRRRTPVAPCRSGNHQLLFAALRSGFAEQDPRSQGPLTSQLPLSWLHLYSCVRIIHELASCVKLNPHNSRFIPCTWAPADEAFPGAVSPSRV